jgi:hypothetical protein
MMPKPTMIYPNFDVNTNCEYVLFRLEMLTWRILVNLQIVCLILMNLG